MSRDNCDNSSTAVLAFLAGTVVGAAIALLTTPKTGEQTREMLADYGTELEERAKTLPDDFQEYKET
ncbi:MAG: YtxH domain-containing protein, partial [Proteobacteria bacterium]|nr:YtxH domain-containing protein [Pseudomonadota bacterium]